MNDYQLQLECDLALKRVMAKVDEIALGYYYQGNIYRLWRSKGISIFASNLELYQTNYGVNRL